MFDIRFIAQVPEVHEDGWRGLRGVTVLGDYSEEFGASLHTWPREKYEAQWLEAAERLLGPEATAGFVTSALHSWWVMWREGENVYVHENLIFAEVRESENAPYELLAERVSHNEDGERLSEWEIARNGCTRICEAQGEF